MYDSLGKDSRMWLSVSVIKCQCVYHNTTAIPVHTHVQYMHVFL